MNKLCTLLVLVIFLPLPVLSQTKAELKAYKEAVKNRDKYLYAAKPVQKNFTYTLPYETTVKGHLIVPVMIEGKTYRFMFDTGALTLVSTELRDKLAMKSIFSSKLEDASAQVEEQQMYRIGQMQLGPVVFKDVFGAAVSLAKIEKQFCEKIDGLLGTNILRTCYWKIDYNARTITFSDKSIKPDGNSMEIDFTESFSGSPLILQAIGERPYYSTIDTGASDGLRVPDSLFFNSWKSRGAKIVIGRGKSSMSLFESKPGYEYTVIMDSIYFGNKLIKNQILDIAAGESYITGNKFMEKFGAMILDWKKKKIYLPETDIEEDKAFMSFGLSPVYDNDDLQVGIVWENSIGGINDIDPGDMIISINNIPAKDMPRDEWCWIAKIFNSEDSTGPLPVTIRKKDGSERKLILQKTNLLNRQ